MKIGLIVNPLAGIGGSAGLKGSDGDKIVELALERGAKPKANERAKTVFEILKRDNKLPEIISAPGVMGGDILKELDIDHREVGSLRDKTSADDTIRIAKEIMEEGVDLLVFAGGDGTARNIYDAIGDKIPALGIPAGTKMHSAVFANKPESAALVIERFLKGEGYELLLQEVMDIDEEAFRNEILSTKLYGYLKVPFVTALVQALKSTRSQGQQSDIESICQYAVDTMEENTLYLVGTGSTLKPIMDIMDLNGSLLGVDAVYNGEQIGKDIDEKEILKLLDKYDKAKIIITVIGGQGYLFGRGNQQFSPEVLRRVGKDNIIVLATKTKLNSVGGPLLVDTGDVELNEELKGYYRVVTDYDFYTLKKVG